MIEHFPFWINALFISCCLFSILVFYLSNNSPKKATSIIVIWTIIQATLAYSGFYHNTTTFPPRYALVILPVAIVISYSLIVKKEWILNNKNTKISTFFHTVRFPIEIVLHQLFIYKMIPQLMTYEGYNYDIIMGITALIAGIFHLKNKLSNKLLIIWNIIGLFMIFFILISAILSAKSPFQQFAFNQPNLALNFFPFILLPATIVPLVIWTHFSDIIVLKNNKPKH